MKHTTLSLFALLAIGANAQIADEGFENTGAGSGEWTEASTNFTTPLCNPTCFSTPANAARNGVWWAWFGGAGASGTIPEIGQLDQDANIPTGSTVDLSLWVWMPLQGGTAADFLEVQVDDNVEATITMADTVTYGAAYTELVVSLALYVGGTHNIELYSEQTSGDSAEVANFFVDDVVIEVNGTPVLGLFENEDLPGFQVFPNPADAMLTMNFNALEGSGVVTITDVTGKVVNSQVLSQLFQRTYNFDTRALPNGMYTVTLENGGKTYSQRAVVAH